MPQADRMHMKIYVVIGEMGEYSDYKQWLVKGFSEKNCALEFISKAQKISDDLYLKYKGKPWEAKQDGGHSMDSK